jgi:hypothetical protein
MQNGSPLLWRTAFRRIRALAGSLPGLPAKNSAQRLDFFINNLFSIVYTQKERVKMSRSGQ